ncbi:P-loop containing nucleoside triphosphate hydrolase protein [Delphinella strobiligena]|nr:P-loop containing nucleoside triphosphate hydrolase protein [Delphinella strobiligena]
MAEFTHRLCLRDQTDANFKGGAALVVITEGEERSEFWILSSASRVGLKCSGADDSNFKLVVSKLQSFIGRKDEVLLQRKENLAVAEMRSKPAFVVPFLRDPNFVGQRDSFGNDILDRITKRHEPAALEYHTRVTLYGLGGVGKSQIAIEYAYRYRELYPATSIFWINASGPPRFKASYEAIAKTLKLPGFDDPKREQLDLVFQWLLSEESGPWLTILDNIDDQRFVQTEDGGEIAPGYEFTMARYLPQKPGGAILITSRDRNAAFSLLDQSAAFGPLDQESPMVHLLEMHEDEAKALLDKQTPADRGTNDEKIELIRALDYLPLAITQAAAYIRKRHNMTVSKYLKLLLESEHSESTPLHKGIIDHRRYEGVPNSILMTWQISFDQIRETDEAAADLLSLICMFDRQSIPRYLFCKDFSTEKLDEAIETLLGYSIIYAEVGAEMFDMHRLVQLATKQWLRLHGGLEKQAEAAISVLAASYPIGKYENWQICQKLEPHAETILRNQFESENGMLLQSLLQDNRAWYFMQQGRYSRAENLYTSVMAIKRRILGEDDRGTLASMSNLAEIYIDQGRFDEAKDVLLASLNTMKRVLDEADLYTLNNMSRLSKVYVHQGKYEEAEKLEAVVLEAKKRVLGKDNLGTLVSMNILASIYVEQGRFKQAEELQVAVLETRKRVLSDGHPSTLISMNNLAKTYFDQGQSEQAEKILVVVLETSKRVLGEGHPDTLPCMNNLAMAYGPRALRAGGGATIGCTRDHEEGFWRGPSTHHHRHGQPCSHIQAADTES